MEELKAKNAAVTGGDADTFSSLDKRQVQSPLEKAEPTVRPSATPSPPADSLPQSLTEIYDISNRNRWRNKDKKRNREPSAEGTDLATSDPSSGQAPGSSEGAADMEGEWYAAGEDLYSDKGLEGTVRTSFQLCCAR